MKLSISMPEETIQLIDAFIARNNVPTDRSKLIRRACERFIEGEAVS